MADPKRPLDIHEVRHLLYDAIHKDDESNLRKVLSDFSYMIDNDLAYAAVNDSIRQGSATAFKTILSWRTGILTERYTTELLEGAIVGKNRAVWDMVYKGYQASGVKKVKTSDLFSMAVKADWPDVARELCKDLTGTDYAEKLVSAAAKNAHSELQFILSCAEYFSDTSEYMKRAFHRAAEAELMGNLDLIAKKISLPCQDAALNRFFRNAISAGYDDDAIRLLSYGADPNDGQGEAMWTAIAKNNLPMLDKLVKQGGDVKKYCHTALDDLLKNKIAAGDDETAIRLLSYGADPNKDQGESMCIAIARNNPAMLQHLIENGGNIEKHCEDIVKKLSKDYPGAQVFSNVQDLADKARSERMLREEERKYTLADSHTLSYEMKLQDSMVLTTLFNFKLRQQVSIVRDAKNDRLTMDVKSFDEVLGDDEVAKLRDKLIARGGKVDYSQDGKKSQKPPLGKALGGK